jgi:polysaccharide pyruvyl transferase WcaK-like protein
VVLFTSERTDRDVVKLVREHFEGQGEPPLECSLPDRLDELLRTLSGLDAIVTSRLHGIILSHVLGKPAAALSYDRKVRAHMNDMGQEAYCMDIDAPGLANAPAMMQKLIAERADAASRVRAALSVRKAQVMHQYAQLANIALAGSRGR